MVPFYSCCSMTSKQLINCLITNKWSHRSVAYGTEKNPDTRDGMFRTIELGNHKYSDGYVNSLIYHKMQKLNERLKTQCKVEKIETDSQVGGAMSVRVEHFEQLLEELGCLT